MENKSEIVIEPKKLCRYGRNCRFQVKPEIKENRGRFRLCKFEHPPPCTTCGALEHEASDHCTACRGVGHQASAHCTECKKVGHSSEDHCPFLCDKLHTRERHTCTICKTRGHEGGEDFEHRRVNFDCFVNVMNRLQLAEEHIQTNCRHLGNGKPCDSCSKQIERHHLDIL